MFDVTKEFSSSDIKELQSLSKEQLLDLKKEALLQQKRYSSGHEHIFDANNVLDNIANFIEMSTDTSFAKRLNVTVAGNGSTYDKTVDGVIPSAMTFLFNERVILKTEMKEKQKLLQKKIEELKELEKSSK